MEWLSQNAGTIMVGLILIAIVAGIICKMIKDKKSGKGTCSCGSDCSKCSKCK